MRAGILWLLLLATASPALSSPGLDTGKGPIFLHHADPQFLEGLRRHDMLRNWGYRLHNTSFDQRPFREKWSSGPLLEAARKSGRYYYIDRVTGGMPIQSLEGIEEIARELGDDPRFLGFQVHEWGHAPMADYRRIQELFVKKNVPLTRESFAQYEGRLAPPYFSCGGFDLYKTLYRPLGTLQETDAYIRSFMTRMVERTSGAVMAVNGYVQLYHDALELGASHVMAEIGNQVQLTAMQIACVRGAARQYGKPFGVYYEPWGGRPFGCPCAIGWSPWFSNRDAPDRQLDAYPIRPGLGSSRSLHRRLLYYAWLSGTTFVGEEWGAENYFANWDDYPLTDYGRVGKEFIEVSGRFSRPEPIVPAAIVLPPGTGGLDLQYLSGEHETVHHLAEPDAVHRILRRFAGDVLGAQPKPLGRDDYNLTPSPWIGCFDVLKPGAGQKCATAVPAAGGQSVPCATAVSAVGDHKAPNSYNVLIFLDEKQMADCDSPATKVLYLGRDGDSQALTAAIRPHPRFRVEGEVGVVQAHADGRHLVGVFNNLGITKTEQAETADPGALRAATIFGPTDGMEAIVGGAYITRRGPNRIELLLPAGQLVVLSFPE